MKLKTIFVGVITSATLILPQTSAQASPKHVCTNNVVTQFCLGGVLNGANSWVESGTFPDRITAVVFTCVFHVHDTIACLSPQFVGGVKVPFSAWVENGHPDNNPDNYHADTVWYDTSGNAIADTHLYGLGTP